MKASKDSLIFELIKDENYLIEESGKISKRVRAWDKKIKKPLFKPMGYTDDKGYRRLEYKGRNLRIHRIIWAKFKGYLRKDLVINHIDGNKSNNAVSNLELVTQSSNALHCYSRLERKAPRSKLSWTEANEIRELWSQKTLEGQRAYTQKKLCEKYGISKGRMSEICNGNTYRNKANHVE